MKYLLDTHAIIWLFTADEKLSGKAKSIIKSEDNALCVSVVSLWEIAIKVSAGKADFKGDTKAFLQKLKENEIELIGILPEHLYVVEALPFVHRDPFDRLLISVAKAEDTTLITADENIHKYDVDWVW